MLQIPDDVKSLLGTMPDREIARRYHITPIRIFRLRRKLGIAPFTRGPRIGVFVRIPPALLQRIDAQRLDTGQDRGTFICQNLERVIQ